MWQLPQSLFTLIYLAYSSTSTSARVRTTTPPAKLSPQNHPGWFQSLNDATYDLQAADIELSNEKLYEAGVRRKGTSEDELGQQNSSHNHEKDQAATPDELYSNEEGSENVGVGVKSHANHKKSNAVGDPDGEGSDDDESDSDTDSALWENVPMMDLSKSPLQLEVEVVKETQDVTQNSNAGDLELDSDEADPTTSAGDGGVGLRLGRLASRHLRNKNRASQKDRDESTSYVETIIEAWKQFIFFPPGSAALDYLSRNSRQFDSAGKIRLDRRTLYAGLILEWLPHLSSLNSGHRKYLEPSTSQALQAALSMACQPEWRKTWPRHNAIRLYDSDSIDPKACTLAMQETIAMALAHSLGTGLVFLDDMTLLSLRKKLVDEGVPEAALKPAKLVKALISHAQSRALVSNQMGSSIAQRMRKDLELGLDDPFDERANMSLKEMGEWETLFSSAPSLDTVSASSDGLEERQLPLVIFVRVDYCKSLLKSKSAVDSLLKECSLNESINLVVLGKGVDAKTTALAHESPERAPQDQHDGNQGIVNPAAPWFSFSQNNQNASGQNDPEGSRRFNIFLARTTDANGNPGVMGAIASPQAGNLFPHMMAMQAQERMQHQHDHNSQARADFQKWAQMLQLSTNGSPLAPPQFFNASLSPTDNGDNENVRDSANVQMPPSPEIIRQSLQIAMSELFERLFQRSDESAGIHHDLPPDLQSAFVQVLRNENLRRGIAENLARAAPALADPKCQGVMLSIYVPPPPHMTNRAKQQAPQPVNRNQSQMGNWFQKILNNQEASDDSEDANSQKKRIRTLAAAAAVMGAQMKQDSTADVELQSESKAERNLARLEALCRPIIVNTPSDPVRAKSWEAWVSRERGAAIFRNNRKVLNDELARRSLSIQEHVGTRGAGSSLRQMLSVREIGADMEEVIRCAVELEAAKSQRQKETPSEMHEREIDLEVDITLSQLLLTDEGIVEQSGTIIPSPEKHSEISDTKFLHPSSLEKAITIVCRISPSPAGGLTLSTGAAAAHRTREEIAALAQDKHERALISQVVSPQDIGVTYDMIGGLSSVKELLRQSITYPLKYPHLYSEGIAREAVKGVLLFGPPGTGKTMLAKAVATEGGASFLSVDASSVENKWLGESEKNAKAVFTLARRLAPCVIFIDEVDSLLSSREGTSDDSAHGTLTSVKTTMMSEWDGLNSGTNGAGDAGSDRVVVIGSTNRPFDLDEAVLRRFPRRILVDLPDLETRTEILEVTLAENRIDPSVNLTKIAERLDGYTGSDIKEVCREAVVQISHEQAKRLDQNLVGTRGDMTQGSLQRLRPVTNDDFEKALSKLKRSVSEKGKELARVWEWNDEYGEIKREKRNQLPHLANMYL